jgi:hypothetical protein
MSAVPESVQAVMMEQIKAMNAKLDTILENTWQIPTLAIAIKTMPTGMKRFDPRNAVTDTYTLHLICGHTFELVPCGPKGEGFPFKQTKEYFAAAIKKMAPVLTVGLLMVKVAATMYGIPLPLPNISQLSNGIDATNHFVNDALIALNEDVGVSAGTIDALVNKIKDAKASSCTDIMKELNMTTEQQRIAYEAMQTFFEKPEYKPAKYGLVKRTSRSGITKWIKDDPAVIQSFLDNDGRPGPQKK